jgi:Type IV secretion system pilin
MLRIFSLILILLFSGISGVFAAACQNTSTLTKADFKLDLGCMDPLGGSHTGGGVPSEGGVAVLTTLLGRIAGVLLFVVPVIAVISLMVAGYFYIFSAGDSEKTTKAKTIIKWNIIAIVIAFLSYGIVNLIAQFF